MFMKHIIKSTAIIGLKGRGIYAEKKKVISQFIAHIFIACPFCIG